MLESKKPSTAASYIPAIICTTEENLAGKTGDALRVGKSTLELVRLFDYLAEVKQHHDEQAVSGMSENKRIMFERDNPDEFSYPWYLSAAGVVAKRAAAGDAVCAHIVRSGLAVSESIMNRGLLLDKTYTPEVGLYSRVMQ